MGIVKPPDAPTIKDPGVEITEGGKRLALTFILVAILGIFALGAWLAVRFESRTWLDDNVVICEEFEFGAERVVVLLCPER